MNQLRRLPAATAMLSRACYSYAIKRAFSMSSSLNGVSSFQSTFFSRSLVDFSRAPGVDPLSFPLIAIPDFINEIEEAAALSDVESQLKRLRYDDGHFDGVILHFRERTYPIAALSASSQGVISRAYSLFPKTPTTGSHMDSVHAIDLDARGEIRNHVDSIKFSGSIICGISLLSDAIMRLTEEPCTDGDGDGKQASLSYHGLCEKDTCGLAVGGMMRDGRPVPRQIDIQLPRRSLYMLHGDSRYKWGHAILGSSGRCRRERRISLILRDELATASMR